MIKIEDLAEKFGIPADKLGEMDVDTFYSETVEKVKPVILSNKEVVAEIRKSAIESAQGEFKNEYIKTFGLPAEYREKKPAELIKAGFESVNSDRKRLEDQLKAGNPDYARKEAELIEKVNSLSLELNRREELISNERAKRENLEVEFNQKLSFRDKQDLIYNEIVARKDKVVGTNLRLHAKNLTEELTSQFIFDDKGLLFNPDGSKVFGSGKNATAQKTVADAADEWIERNGFAVKSNAAVANSGFTQSQSVAPKASPFARNIDRGERLLRMQE
jgi:hypothetical protein